MIITGALLIWRASVIVQRFLHQEKLEVSLVGMIEELEAATRSGIAAIEAERKKVEKLLAELQHQTGNIEIAAAGETSEANKANEMNQKKETSEGALTGDESADVSAAVGDVNSTANVSSVIADTTAGVGNTGNDGSSKRKRYEVVWQLTDAGVSSIDIARQLGMGRGEVELIQELRSYCDPHRGTTGKKS